MKPFLFKQFSIQQSNSVFRVGTDGVLLGAASTVYNAINILEVGTGTGLISLMLAQRNHKAQIDAIDLSEEASTLAEKNFGNSPFADRLNIFLQDYKTLHTKKKYDLIISNPPYFNENISTKDVIARQQTELSFELLIKRSKDLLAKNGIFSVIIPFESGRIFEAYCNSSQLYLHRRLVIYGIKDSKPKRLILEFGLDEKETSEEKIVIEKSPRKYSEAYLKLTEEFHQFISS